MAEFYKRFDFTQQGGFPMNQQRLEFMQEAYAGLAEVIAQNLGNNVIAAGVDIPVNGNTVTDGWIVVNNQLMPFIGSNDEEKTVYPYVFDIITEKTPLTFKNQIKREVQFYTYATLNPAGAYNLASLKRLNILGSERPVEEYTVNETGESGNLTATAINANQAIITGAVFVSNSSPDEFDISLPKTEGMKLRFKRGSKTYAIARTFKGMDIKIPLSEDEKDYVTITVPYPVTFQVEIYMNNNDADNRAGTLHCKFLGREDTNTANISFDVCMVVDLILDK